MRRPERGSGNNPSPTGTPQEKYTVRWIFRIHSSAYSALQAFTALVSLLPSRGRSNTKWLLLLAFPQRPSKEKREIAATVRTNHRHYQVLASTLCVIKSCRRLKNET